jgi:hypothetical protein
MKQWTKRFLDRPVKKMCLAIKNAESANNYIKLPSKLWMELTDYSILFSKLIRTLEKKVLATSLEKTLHTVITTAFMAGVAVGWAEKKREIK